ncbi:Nucleobase-ascorbate transporter 11, partial [Ananas comosus]
MDVGTSSSKGLGNGGGGGDGPQKARPPRPGAGAGHGPWQPRIEPFVPNTDHNPRELKSWAKRTGFNPNLSGETAPSERDPDEPPPPPPPPPPARPPALDLEKGLAGAGGRRRRLLLGEGLFGRAEIEPAPGRRRPEIKQVVGAEKEEGKREEEEPMVRVRNESLNGRLRENGGHGVAPPPPVAAPRAMEEEEEEEEEEVKKELGKEEEDDERRVEIGFFPDSQEAENFSGLLSQGSSFVYLAPALKFKHIMRELQGAIIVGSVFQTILGYSGLMSLLLRLINPVVVAPTVAAVGLAFFSYGFPQAGSCVEISIPLIVLVLIFTL